jgi:hypothetical protein
MDEQKMRNEVHIRIGTDGIEFDAKGDIEFIERERNAFEAKLLPLGVDAITRTRIAVQVPQIVEANEIQRLQQINANLDATTQRCEHFTRVSLASYVKQKGAESNNDFILCAAYFNEKKNGISSFSSTTAKEFYSEAKKPLPSNVSMVINQLASKGLIMENPSMKGANPKEYVLTTDGEETVIQMQPIEGKVQKTTAKTRKPRSKMKSAYADINCDELNLDNYPDVKLLKDFKEKMMMVIYIITKEKKGEWFTNNDILCLMTDIFGESATKDQVNGVFKREKIWFKAEKIEGSGKEIKRKILNKGIEYVQSIIDAN